MAMSTSTWRWERGTTINSEAAIVRSGGSVKLMGNVVR